MGRYNKEKWDTPQPDSSFEKGNQEMKTVCAWCGAHMKGEEDCPLVSHGICKECVIKESGQGG